jgi:hypothetical protein
MNSKKLDSILKNIPPATIADEKKLDAIQHVFRKDSSAQMSSDLQLTFIPSKMVRTNVVRDVAVVAIGAVKRDFIVE